LNDISHLQNSLLLKTIFIFKSIKNHIRFTERTSDEKKEKIQQNIYFFLITIIKDKFFT